MTRGESVVDMAELEATREVEVIYLGRLKDLSIGNPDGIPSPLSKASEEEVLEYGERLKGALDTITDHAHLGCIDGRCVVCNADGSTPQVRGRQVSGTGSLLEEAHNAEASVLDTIDPDASLGEQIEQLEAFYERVTGIKPSAHRGGCGGVNGAIEDNKAIATNPDIIAVTETFMGLPVVSEFTSIPFNAALSQRVKLKAAETAQDLEARGWEGQKYVDGAAKREPAGCEELETAEDKFHGHKEAGVVFVLSRDRSISEAKQKELGLEDMFVVGIQQSVDQANAFGGQRGFEGVQQALIANIAKHVAVADRLPHEDDPVFILKDY